MRSAYTRRWSAPARLAVVLGSIVLLGCAAVLIRDDDRESPGAAHRAGPSEVVHSKLTATVPPNWQPGTKAPAPRLLGMRDPLVLTETLFGNHLLAEQLPATSPSLVPAGLLENVSAPRGPDRVSFSGGLRAWHFTGLLHRRLKQNIDVYVAPTTAGVLTVACLSEPAYAATQTDCGDVARRIRVSGARPLPLDSLAAFRSRLPAVIAGVEARRAVTRRRLADARRNDAGSVAELSDSYAEAATVLRALLPRRPGWPGRIVESLEAGGVAYARLSAAVGEMDRRAYRDALSRAREVEATLRRLLRARTTTA